MSTSLLLLEAPTGEPLFALTQTQTVLRQMVLDSVQSVHSKRNYAKALGDLFAFCVSRRSRLGPEIANVWKLWRENRTKLNFFP